MSNESERLQILEMIEKGVISASEGVRLLNSLQGELDLQENPEENEGVVKPQLNYTPSASAKSSLAPEVIVEEPSPESKTSSPSSEFNTETRKWRRFWWIPLTVGIVITVVSGLLMFLAYQSKNLFLFGCLWVPLLFGVLVLSLGAASRAMRWLHVRVHQEPGERPQTIAISMPIPVRFVAWVLRVFKPHIPNMDKANLDEVILALDKISPDQPFYVKVDEGDSGEKVEVFIG